MSGAVIKAVIASLLMVGSTGAVVYMTPPERPADPLGGSLEAAIPDAFGDWKIDRSIVPIPMSADVESALYAVYDAVLGRTYVNSAGSRMMLSIGYSRQQGGIQKPHWQEVCYRAQGFSIDDLVRGSAVIAGRDIPVTRMVATMRTRIEPVTYWLTLGDHVVKDRWDRTARLLLLGLERESTDGYLIRVSSLNPNVDEAFAEQARFADALMSAVSPAEARKLVGAK